MAADGSSRRVVLVRHGETAWSRARRHTGATDVPLTAAGRRQARAAGRLLGGRRFALVLSSPLARARETCALAALDPPALLRDDLREWDYGDYEGLTSAEIDSIRPGWDLFRDGSPGGEDAAAVGRRADRVLAELSAVAGDCALFAHGHLLRVLTARWLGLAPGWGGRFALSTGAVSELGHEHGRPALWRWNETVES